MTINNKSERNYRGKCLGWPVTSYGAVVANFQGPSVWNHPIDVDIKSSSLSLLKKEMKQHFIKDY